MEGEGGGSDRNISKNLFATASQVFTTPFMSPLGYWWKWRLEGSYLKESGGGQGEETSPNPTAKLWREAPLKPAGRRRVTLERREQTGEAMSTDYA